MPGDVLPPAKRELLERLKDWRMRTAKELDQPAFVIFSDKALRDLIAKNPESVSELNGVYGFGPAKIEKFGAEVLRELRRLLISASNDDPRVTARPRNSYR